MQDFVHQPYQTIGVLKREPDAGVVGQQARGNLSGLYVQQGFEGGLGFRGFRGLGVWGFRGFRGFRGLGFRGLGA